MEEAIGNDLKVVIPIKFSMISDGKQTTVSIGEGSKEEVLETGKSSTQSQKYEFLDLNLTTIDTPGIGDHRGFAQDNENLEHILRYLSRFSIIDRICILLKPNEARASIVSKYCFKGLLFQLDKSAIKKVVFCYTNSRGTFYQPGDSALKNNIPFNDEQIKDFSNSWKISVCSTEKLISYLNLIPSHDVRKTNHSNIQQPFVPTLLVKVIKDKNGREMPQYTQRCNVNCSVDPEINNVNCFSLRKCSSMNKSSLKCKLWLPLLTAHAYYT
ncbi:hypothetical protein ACTFIV_003707 [Dictyostelium citrinum]